jgi:hypothetical protein
MSTFSKIFVTLSMLCYLATSSVAAVHAFPMMGNLDKSQTVAMDSVVSISVESKKEQAAEAVMPCHQITSSAIDNTKASGACKTFCSATSHGLLSIDAVDVVVTHHNRSPYFGINNLLSRHTSVDHQPPK